MATLGKSVIINERAPVTAWSREAFHLGKMVMSMEEGTRKFRNYEEFSKWYWPPSHGEPGVNPRYLFTDVLVDHIRDAVKGASIRAPRAAGGGSTKSRVTVDGIPYGSVFKAFEALGLPIKDHGPFRAKLKKVGELDYAGKKFRVMT
jgi:hypothetical protein